MPWGMMEKLLEKSMCNAVRRKRYLEKKSSLLSCDDDHDDGGGGHYSQSEITGKQRIPSWQIAPHVWPLNTLLKCFTKRVLITLLSPSESQDWCTLPERVSHLHTGKQSFWTGLNTTNNLQASKRWRRSVEGCRAGCWTDSSQECPWRSL